LLYDNFHDVFYDYLHHPELYQVVLLLVLLRVAVVLLVLLLLVLQRVAVVLLVLLVY
jgi:hypothetical protein